MNTRPEDTITLTVLLALGSASCDQPLAAPETPMVTTVSAGKIM